MNAHLGILLAATIVLPAHAELLARELDGASIPNAYYDTSLNITWLANANLAATNTFGVNGINSDGSMTWFVAQSWIAAMNVANYLGYNDWRLPTTAPVNGAAFAYKYSALGNTDLGYNISAPGTAYAGSLGSEMSNLYYNSLGNKASYNPTTGQPQAGYGLTNTGPFLNLQTPAYWSDTEYAPVPLIALVFDTLDGSQALAAKYTDDDYAWAVRPGDVVTVPEPGSLMLAVLGLGGIAATRRRG